MSEYYDTYFINTKRAMKIAKQKNNVSLYNGHGTQICYYSGEEIKNTPSNMIYLPLDDVKSFFYKTDYRLPEFIDFIGSVYEDLETDQNNFKDMILNIFNEIEETQAKDNEELFKQVKRDKNEPIDFNHIKFIIIVSKTLYYDYYFAKKMKSSLESLGHNVNILAEKGSSKKIINTLKTNYIYNNILNIKPDVVIFINDFKPELITEEKYQISIINGFIPLLKDIKNKTLREKDIICTQNYYVSDLLKKDNIKNEIIEHASDFKSKTNNSEPKEDILLICNNYQDLKGYLILKKMTKKLFKSINKTPLTIKMIKTEMSKTDYKNENDSEMLIYLQKNIVLQSCLKWLEHDGIQTKLVGHNWKEFKKLPKEIKIPKKQSVKKAYKKAKYILHIAPSIIDVNLLDILKNGAIPIIYDLRDSLESYDKRFDDFCLFYKNKQELNHILQNRIEPKERNAMPILKEYSFDHLSKDIIKLISK